MSGDLVNAFGKIALDVTGRDSNELLYEILVEMRILNEHFARMRNEVIDRDELDDEDLLT